MEDLYAFVDKYIEEMFETEAVLKTSPRGTITKLRKKTSHQRYICRRFSGSGDVYSALLGKRCAHLPQIYEAAYRMEIPDSCEGHGMDEMRQTIVLEEYLVGDTLAMLLQAGPLTGSQVKNISIQLCRGLHVLHSLGWVHRDIKPENVMLCPDRVVLIDFDAARNYVSEKTKDTRVLGTVGYAPPEQYGISETDYRADIYAMGVLINEMLTGEHPSQVLAGGHWGRIISRCTMINPKKRYASVHELMEAI